MTSCFMVFRWRDLVIDKPDLALRDVLRISDVVISGVPGDKYKVPTELVRDGAICINFSSEKVSHCSMDC